MAIGARRECAAVLRLVALRRVRNDHGHGEPAPFPGRRRHGADCHRSARLVEKALALRGTPYLLGGDEPATGLDCSGLVRHVFRAEGLTVPRTVAEQFGVGAKVEPAISSLAT